MTFVSTILRHFSGWQGAVRRHRHAMATEPQRRQRAKGQKRATNVIVNALWIHAF